MCTALRCIDIIYKTIGILCIGIIMLQSNLYRYTILLTFTVNDLRVKCLFTSVQVAYKLTDTTLIVEYLLALLSLSLIPRTIRRPLVRKAISRSLCFRIS